jgi:hypothetical protein
VQDVSYNSELVAMQYAEPGVTVICTYMNEIGVIPDDVYRWDAYYGQKFLGETVLRGYHLWAIPLVAKMRRSPRLTNLIAPFACAWAQEMAHRCDPQHHNGNVMGKVMLMLGVAPCFVLGKIVSVLGGSFAAIRALKAR